MSDNSSVAVGQMIGTISGLVALALGSAALLGAGGTILHLHDIPRILLGLLALIGLLAVLAAWAENAAALVLLALLSLVPVGLYLVGVPHWLKWVGVANLGYIAAAALLWSGSRRDRSDGASAC